MEKWRRPDTTATLPSLQPSAAKVALVTGASSGIGWETTRLLAQQGFLVFAASRGMPCFLQQARLEPGLAQQIRALTLDILDTASCEMAVQTVLTQAGRLDALVHCAGAGLAGAIEEIPLSEAFWQYDNLLYGTIRLVHAALPHLRQQGGGRIVLVTSVAAVIPIPFQTYYSSAKAAVQAFALGLDAEVRPLGVRVSVVAPGDTRTGFTAARRLAPAAVDSPYASRIARSVQRMEQDEQNGMPPAAIARVIVRQLTRRSPRLLAVPGLQYKILVELSRLLPLAFVRRVVANLYAR
jgi:NAD(P)-dependent dehydrogenase (short-subunit alcohol dehydrogenase family)